MIPKSTKSIEFVTSHLVSDEVSNPTWDDRVSRVPVSSGQQSRLLLGATQEEASNPTRPSVAGSAGLPGQSVSGSVNPTRRLSTPVSPVVVRLVVRVCNPTRSVRDRVSIPLRRCSIDGVSTYFSFSTNS